MIGILKKLHERCGHFVDVTSTEMVEFLRGGGCVVLPPGNQANLNPKVSSPSKALIEAVLAYAQCQGPTETLELQHYAKEFAADPDVQAWLDGKGG